MGEVIYFSDILNTNDDDQIIYGQISGNDEVMRASTHQVSIYPGNGATGTLKIAVMGKKAPGLNLEVVKDENGADLVIDLANGSQSYVFEGSLSLIATTPQGAITVGYSACISGW